MIPTHSRMSLEEKETRYGRESRVVIKGVKEEDFAAYNCTASNSLGIQSALINFQEKGYFIFLLFIRKFEKLVLKKMK